MGILRDTARTGSGAFGPHITVLGVAFRAPQALRDGLQGRLPSKHAGEHVWIRRPRVLAFAARHANLVVAEAVAELNDLRRVPRHGVTVPAVLPFRPSSFRANELLYETR